MSTVPVVAHVIHSLDTGGLENGVVNLVNATPPDLQHVIVCMTGVGAMRQRLTPSVEVFSLGKRPGQDVGAVARLVRLLRRVRPAIVHSRNWAAFDAVPAARLAGVPVVVHGEHGRDIADPHGRNARRNRLRRVLSPLITRFVTVSHDLARWLVDEVRVPARKVLTIHNGVPLERFAGTSAPEARRRLGLPADVPIVGTVGRLDPVKDQAGLVRSFAATLSAHPDACLVVAGEGPCRADLTRLIDGLGVERQVMLLGDRPDVPTVLGALDLFVLPSIAEGMSNTVLEAMAAGLPVVATRVGGNPEMVEDGVTGRLVRPQDPAGLAAVIAAYLEDPHLRAAQGKAGRQRAAEHFGLERMCSAYTDLYRRLLPGPATAAR